ncbi:MAG: dGTP triphosphohydrolase [Pseudomonadota bacterium]
MMGQCHSLGEAVVQAQGPGNCTGHLRDHTGEDALQALMAPYGGFDHNAQAIKIVTRLECHYADFDGLNLTWETLEGIAKHNGPLIGELPYGLAEYDADHDLELSTHASAEAQVAALSDDIAYNNHDLHDGLRAGLFDEADICDLPMIGPAFAEVDARYPGLDPTRRRHEGLRRVFGIMVTDVVETSRMHLAHSGAQSVEDVRALGRPVVRFSDGLWRDLKQIRTFLFTNMYRAPSVMAKREEVTCIVNDLFPLFLSQPDLLPGEWRRNVDAQDEVALARSVSDYISGMTDRFALQEHARLIG